MKVFEYADRLKIYQSGQGVAEYPLPPDGVTNKAFSPEGMPQPARQPKNRKRATQEEEKRLRALSPRVEEYLKFSLSSLSNNQRHRFLRELFRLSGRMTTSAFIQTVERALRYRIADIETLQRIARLGISQGEVPLSDVEVDESFRQRATYQQGSLTDAPDFSLYDQMLDDNEDNDG